MHLSTIICNKVRADGHETCSKKTENSGKFLDKSIKLANNIENIRHCKKFFSTHPSFIHNIVLFTQV